MLYPKVSELPLHAWLMDTIKSFSEHPERWPIEKETPIEDSAYWAGLCVKKVMLRDGETWNFDVTAFRGPDANLLMSMTLESGNVDDILLGMRHMLAVGASKPLVYIEKMCDRIEEKDDDYHDGFWD